MIWKICLAFGCAVIAVAQTAPSSANNTGSITGMVTDAGGAPIAYATVNLDRKRVDADTNGRFTMLDVAPGVHQLSAQTPPKPHSRPGYSTKTITIAAGKELTVNFALTLPSEISGRVVDQNKEPVADASVFLIGSEYTLGTLRHFYVAVAETDDQGEYTLHNVEPGRAYLLMAAVRKFRLPAISDAPSDPKLRRPAFAATYYPGTSSAQGAEQIILRAREHREDVQLRVLRTPSYCVEGVLNGPNGPAAFHFELADREPASGSQSSGGGMFVSRPGGVTGPDGKIRICGLYPGEFELVAYIQNGNDAPLFFGSTTFLIGNRDISDFSFTAQPRTTIPGEVAWEVNDANAPAPPLAENFRISIWPVARAPWRSEIESPAKAAEGQFTFKNVLLDQYAIRLNGIPPEAYVKDISYAGHNVQYEPLVAGSAIGEASLRILLARDGAKIAAKVADKDGDGVSDATVLIMPVTVPSEAAMAAMIVKGQCDQNGAWTSGLLAPGKYYAAALERPYNNSPENISKLWNSRTRMKEVELTANKSAQVTLSLLDVP